MCHRLGMISYFDLDELRQWEAHSARFCSASTRTVVFVGSQMRSLCTSVFCVKSVGPVVGRCVHLHQSLQICSYISCVVNFCRKSWFRSTSSLSKTARPSWYVRVLQHQLSGVTFPHILLRQWCSCSHLPICTPVKLMCSLFVAPHFDRSPGATNVEKSKRRNTAGGRRSS